MAGDSGKGAASASCSAFWPPSSSSVVVNAKRRWGIGDVRFGTVLFVAILAQNRAETLEALAWFCAQPRRVFADSAGEDQHVQTAQSGGQRADRGADASGENVQRQ